jgi:hypothetical protein
MILYPHATSQNHCIANVKNSVHLLECQIARLKDLKRQLWNVSGGECERRSIRVWLGGNSCPISAMSDVHHRHSKQSFPTDSGKVCSGVKFDHDECTWSKHSTLMTKRIQQKFTHIRDSKSWIVLSYKLKKNSPRKFLNPSRCFMKEQCYTTLKMYPSKNVNIKYSNCFGVLPFFHQIPDDVGPTKHLRYLMNKYLNVQFVGIFNIILHRGYYLKKKEELCVRATAWIRGRLARQLPVAST